MEKPAKWIDAKLGVDTLCVHGGVNPDATTGAILTPIYQTTTFVQPSVEGYMDKGFSYTRCGNPTVEALERKIAELEGIPSESRAAAASMIDTNWARGGATCFNTGMAATFAVFAAFLKTGDHCILTNCSYGGTNRCARVHFSKYNIEFDYLDFRDAELIRRSVRSNTRLIFSESPTNPTLSLADVEAISKIAQNAGIYHVCDSTFATPIAMQPLKLGADIVLHSTTKFFDGHNITVGGAVITRNKEVHEMVQLQRNICGSIMSPHVAFYTLQTLKTLAIRVERQSTSARHIAKTLQGHPKVAKVVYPGLESFPQRELALKQHQNDIQGGMLWFEVEGGTDAGIRLMNTIKRPWSLCENLGACESIITCPAVFTHANMLREDRLKVGITDGFIRVSVGLESCSDLTAALIEALDNL